MKFDRRSIAIVFATAVFFGSLYYIYLQFDWNEIYVVVSGANLNKLLLCGGVTILLFWFFRTLRWASLLKLQGYSELSFVALWVTTSSSLALSVVSPLQSGELAKIELLKRVYPKISRHDAYIAFGIERILDLLVISGVAALGLSLSSAHFKSWSAVGAIIGVALVMLILLNGLVERYKSRYAVFNKISEHSRSLISRPGVLFTTLLLTLCAWLAVVAGWWITLSSIQINLSFTDALGLTGGMTLVNVASLIPGGLGISEMGVSVWLQYLNVGPNLANSAALLTRVYGLLAVIMGFIVFGIANVLYLRRKREF